MARAEEAQDAASAVNGSSVREVVPKPPEITVPPVSFDLPPESGLEMVETRHAAPVEPSSAEQAPTPRRVRPPRVQPTEEPLQIVETRHESAAPPQS
jgi:hypothetical protein